MESKKRKYNKSNVCQNVQNSIQVVSNELLYEKPPSEKNKSTKESESDDFSNSERSSDFESDSDKKSVVEDIQCKEIRELQEWISTKNIPCAQADDLLSILRQRLLPNLPKDTETLLKSSGTSTGPNDATSENAETDKLENVNPFLQVNVNHSIFNPNNRVTNDENVFNPLDIPIIEIRNEDMTDFQRNVLLQLSEINKNICFLKQRQDDMINFLLDRKVLPVETTIFTDFYRKYHYKIPLETMESFLQFDEQLKNDTFLMNDVSTELRRLVDKDFSITKSYVQMLKKFLKKEVALQFTAARKSRLPSLESRRIFKPTEFCKCMFAAVAYRRSETALETTDSMLISGLSDVLCNVKNWYKIK